MTEFVLELDDGESVTVVVPDAIASVQEGMVDAGIREVAGGARRVAVSAGEIIARPVRALGRLFISALPPLDDENFALDAFSLEFKLGLATEGGVENPLVTAKVIPEGNFTCTYTWKRKTPAANEQT